MNIAEGINLPVQLAGHTQVILAQKGAGKTYTAMRQAEELLAAEQQVVALDPTGVWWGLRSPAPGKKGRGFPVIVMGGEHGDIPLDPAAGEIVAEFVVQSGRSVVLDLSTFESNAAQNRFVTDFAEKLYRLKASDRLTMHLMLDEADSFCPQRPQPGEQRMLGAFEAIVRRGRSRGLGITMISQRPAVLNKNVASQADLLVCLRVTGIHDHKALREWTNLFATPEQQKEFMTSLPKLQTGEAWFWSPSWLNIFQRGKVTKRVSYDSSSTPDGTVHVERDVKRVEVDLKGLTKAMEDAAEHAAANDPKKLRAEISELKLRLSNMVKRATEPAEPALTPEEKTMLIRVHRWIEDEFEFKLKGICGDLDNQAVQMETAASKARSSFRQLLTESENVVRNVQAILGKTGHANMQNDLHKNNSRPHPGRVAESPSRAPSGVNGGAAVAKGAGDNSVGKGGVQRMMVALAQRPGLSAKQLGIRAGLSSSGGTFANYLGTMRKQGWMEGDRHSMKLTTKGIEALGSYTPLPTGRALLDYWIGELGQGGISRMLLALAEEYPRAMSRAQLGQVAEVASDGGTFANYLGKLRALELVEDQPGKMLTASAELSDHA